MTECLIRQAFPTGTEGRSSISRDQGSGVKGKGSGLTSNSSPGPTPSGTLQAAADKESSHPMWCGRWGGRAVSI